MVKELSYNTTSHVIETWEQLRRLKNYEEEAGSRLFQKLFTECPQAKVFFGFHVNVDPTSQELLHSKRFLLHASYLIQMLDTAISMLGPDIELLTEIMLELGEKHVRYGVTSDMFPIMGQCLIATLQETLGPKSMTVPVVDAWTTVYAALSEDMVKAHAAHAKPSKRSSNGAE